MTTRPADDALLPLTPSAIADLLDAAAKTVVAELDALGAEAGFRPAPGEWSANECVGHLIEAERRGFAGRIVAILAPGPGAEPPILETWEQTSVAEARQDHLRPAAELRDEFAAMRRESIVLVRGLAPEDLARVGLHPHVGPLRVDDVLHEWVHHDRNHIRQMLAVTQERVWGQMGNARRFSLENL